MNVICLINNNNRYIATEFCSGTLQDYFSEKYQGPRFLSDWKTVHNVTLGLAYLHQLGIVHRDLKPTNILVRVSDNSPNEPQMKLADFGFAKILKTGKEDFTNTNVSNPKGTRGWMAPEVYEFERFDFKVDTFALGCIFGYALSEGNRHPFGDDCNERIDRIRDKSLGMVMVQEDFKESYSSAFELVKSMLEKEPSIRLTVAEVAANPFFYIDLVIHSKF